MNRQTAGDAPAFPMQHTQPDGRHDVLSPGLTKRELFAGIIAAGFYAGPDMDDMPKAEVAKMAREMADALLEELEKA